MAEEEIDKPIEVKQSLEDENAISDLLSDVSPEGEIDKPEPESKPEEAPPKPTPVGTAPEGAEKPPVDDLESELEQYQPPKGSHKGAGAGYAALKGVVKRERGEAQKLKAELETDRARLKELEERVKTPSIPEEVETELKELRKLRREQNIQNDPEFQQKYSSKIKSFEADALQLLSRAGMNKDTVDWVAKRGGIISMSNSDKLMPDNKQTEKEWVEEVVLPRTPELFRDRVKKRIIDALELSDEMGQEVEKAKAEGPQRQQAQMEKVQKEFEDGKNEAIAELGEMGKRWDVPAVASPEEKARIEKHNKRVDGAEAQLQDMMAKAQQPREAAKLLVKAARAEYLKEHSDDLAKELDGTKERLAELQAKYDKVKSSGSHSRPGAAPNPSTKVEQKPLREVSDFEALDEAFNKLDQ